MNEQLSQLLERLKQAQNVMVTVSKNPSVDQLAAAIGLTLALNALDKHATAVYSGETPSTIDFLKPEETLEGNTDSLRDFIIALDKSKADKLRYKVEDQVVRIFITPYRTSITERDLDFSQGDFNVDVVIALGVQTQQDLDDAVQAHGRILHDATVASLSTGSPTELGTINWVDAKASSLSEMATRLVEGLSKKAMDGQIATALLTGIVATTERFSNEKTTPDTMSVSAKLMAAGANQQLIATELAEPEVEQQQAVATTSDVAAPEQPRDPGMLEIDHSAEQPSGEAPKHPQIEVDEHGNLRSQDAPAAPQQHSYRERIVEPPSIDSVLSANTVEEALSPPLDELTLPSPSAPPMLSHEHRAMLPDREDEVTQPEEPVMDQGFDTPSGAPVQEPMPEFVPPAEPEMPSTVELAAADDKTLSQIEETVHSPHLQAIEQPATQASGGEPLDQARDALQAAFQESTPQTPEPIAALNAQPLGYELHGNAPDFQAAPPQAPAPGFAPQQPLEITNPSFNEPAPGNSPADDTMDMPMPSGPFAMPGQPMNTPQDPAASPQASNGDRAPDVPPPFVPPLG